MLACSWIKKKGRSTGKGRGERGEKGEGGEGGKGERGGGMKEALPVSFAW